MKKAIAYIPAWGFYWLGDLVSKPIHWSDKMDFLYPVYSILMNWSLFFNDWGGLDIWVDHTDE